MKSFNDKQRKESLSIFNDKLSNIGDYLYFSGKSDYVELDGNYCAEELRMIADTLDEYFENLEQEADGKD